MFALFHCTARCEELLAQKPLPRLYVCYYMSLMLLSAQKTYWE